MSFSPRMETHTGGAGVWKQVGRFQSHIAQQLVTCDRLSFFRPIRNSQLAQSTRHRHCLLWQPTASSLRTGCREEQVLDDAASRSTCKNTQSPPSNDVWHGTTLLFAMQCTSHGVPEPRLSAFLPQKAGPQICIRDLPTRRQPRVLVHTPSVALALSTSLRAARFTTFRTYQSPGTMTHVAWAPVPSDHTIARTTFRHVANGFHFQRRHLLPTHSSPRLGNRNVFPSSEPRGDAPCPLLTRSRWGQTPPFALSVRSESSSIYSIRHTASRYRPPGSVNTVARIPNTALSPTSSNHVAVFTKIYNVTYQHLYTLLQACRVETGITRRWKATCTAFGPQQPLGIPQPPTRSSRLPSYAIQWPPASDRNEIRPSSLPR
ncbi:hypothetical protein FB45DRAFT_864694 [Roridomyces roridus]|uniref:Uncharacterized protein n=1 Tax=Roridomyces roridus TaxID=1738132 RepID=A0AAD7C1N1_9AGAR|nr:hypothetical protein FB45DRAFT_864694 [Roridomyces roridus]